MASPLNLLPQGLLDLFSIKSGGRNPQVLGEQLLPTLELGRWYFESKVLEVNFSFTQIVASQGTNLLSILNTQPVNISNGSNVFVPQDEVWVILPGSRIGCTFNAVAGSSTDTDLAVSNGVCFMRVATGPMHGFTTSDGTVSRGQSRTVETEMWCGPGSLLRGIHFGAVVAVGGTIDISGSLRLVRMRR